VRCNSGRTWSKMRSKRKLIVVSVDDDEEDLSSWRQIQSETDGSK
jgi:hypothetical protein